MQIITAEMEVHMKAPNKQRVQKNCCAVLIVAFRNFFTSLASKRN